DVVAKEVAHMGIRVCTLEPGGMRTDWASEARRGIDDMLPDYEQSVGKMLELLEAYGGHEISDPAKIAALIVQLSRRDPLPLRLVLGGDALHICRLADAERAEELQQWSETSLSTHFPDAQLPAGLDVLKQPK
ncbi:MAG: short-chain dehydrogenase/reductase, partial [Caballeronia sp.]